MLTVVSILSLLASLSLGFADFSAGFLIATALIYATLFHLLRPWTVAQGLDRMGAPYLLRFVGIAIAINGVPFALGRFLASATTIS